MIHLSPTNLYAMVADKGLTPEAIIKLISDSIPDNTCFASVGVIYNSGNKHIHKINENKLKSLLATHSLYWDNPIEKPKPYFTFQIGIPMEEYMVKVDLQERMNTRWQQSENKKLNEDQIIILLQKI